MEEFGFGARWRGWIKECLVSTRVRRSEYATQRARSLGLLRGVVVGHDEVKLSHLQFAEDAISFCEANMEEIMAVKRILRCFELVSGLKITFHESFMCGISVSENEVEEFASRLHCRCQKLPLTYLGLPLGASPRLKKTWKPVLDKCKARLAS
ncbi:uncharacterized protein LOC114315613 [Camellia sinensis]|uniref:uncharacterized protein LOC114315613 n=1 Tax=Camellia sinensis TaxID=4442 RepID=UPI001036C654|nr:uncharacterized protein LOC114315613 [Camellia sinensis]